MMTVKQLVRAGSLAILAAIFANGMVAAWGISTIRVGGPLQLEIDESSELIADILPPPAYVVEAYLETSLLVLDPGRAEPAAERLATLERDYLARQQRWRQSTLPPALTKQIGGDVDAPARQFWQIVKDRLVPAARQGDAVAVRRHFAAASDAYARHRTAVDRLVKAAEGHKVAVAAHAEEAFLQVGLVLAALAVLLVLMTIVMVRLIGRRVITPLATLSETTDRLSAGGEADIEGLDRSDELGLLARAIARFRDNAIERAATEARAAEESRAAADSLAATIGVIAAGDLRGPSTAGLHGDYLAIGEQLSGAVARLRTMVQTVVGSADTIRSAATEIAGTCDNLLRGSEGNAAAVEEIAMAVTEVDEYARKVLAFAENCSVRAGEACDSVTRGRHKAQDAAGAMTRIRDTAADVTGVMEALDKIAFQTRVLAMNAAVEAGTAGEAGRGFAVVADLVAQLAGRAEEEAARARQQLTALAGELGEAASGVLEVEREFDGIVDHVGTVSDLLAALAGDTREQADIIAEVSAAMQRMNDSVQSNAALMDNSAAFAAALMREADQMVEKAAAFKWDRRCRDVPVTIDRRARSGDGTAGAGEPAGAAAGADPVLQTA